MKFSILISEDDPDFQFLFEVAISEIDPSIKLNIVYTGQQVLESMLRNGLNEEGENPDLPEIIIADLKPPFFGPADIKEIRIYKQFKKIPIYLLAADAAEVKKTREMGFENAEVYKKPYTFHDLKELLEKIIRQSRKSKVDKDLFCVRCEDFIEHYQEKNPFAVRVKLSANEKEFISSRYQGSLCIACTNQLKTTYRIINGDYNKEATVIN